MIFTWFWTFLFLLIAFVPISSIQRGPSWNCPAHIAPLSYKNIVCIKNWKSRLKGLQTFFTRNCVSINPSSTSPNFKSHPVNFLNIPKLYKKKPLSLKPLRGFRAVKLVCESQPEIPNVDCPLTSLTLLVSLSLISVETGHKIYPLSVGRLNEGTLWYATNSFGWTVL